MVECVGFTFTVFLDIAHGASELSRSACACAPHSLTHRTPTSRKRSGSTIFVAKLCCCFVDLRFRQTASAPMLVTKACHGNLGFVVVVVSGGACFGPPTAFLRGGRTCTVCCPCWDPPVCPPMPRQGGIRSKAPTLCVRSVRFLSSCLRLRTCL